MWLVSVVLKKDMFSHLKRKELLHWVKSAWIYIKINIFKDIIVIMLNKMFEKWFFFKVQQKQFHFGFPDDSFWYTTIL